jgi:hypothetical protein
VAIYRRENMKILADNEKLLNELYINLSEKYSDVEKQENTTEVNEPDKKYMGACRFLVVVGGIASVMTIIDFLERRFPEYMAIFSTDSLTMTSDEYLEMSEDARKAVEKNFKVIIKKR